MAEMNIVKIKTYYVNHHYDGLSRLNPLILLHGERAWNVGQKKKISGTKMYYLFLDYSRYVKLWRDSKNNLLFTIDNYDSLMFFDEEPDIFALDLFLTFVHWDDDFIICRNQKIEFSIPIIRIVKTINPWAQYPLVYVLHQMFHTQDDTSAPVSATQPQEPDKG